MSTTRTERLGSASSQRRTIRLHALPSSEDRAAPGWHARVNVRVWVVPDVLGARQGIAVLVILDQHRQPTEPELLVPCTPDASLPIDVHVGADHPNEQTFGSAFAHFAALAFPSAALLHEGLPQPSPIMVCTLSSISILIAQISLGGLRRT